MSIGPCPDPERLEAFAAGLVSAGAFRDLADHVAECRHCGSALDGSESETDSVVALLPRTAAAADAGDPLPEEVLARARSVRGEAGHREETVPVLDHGARFAQLLAGGSCRLGRFELRRELGAGTFGHVFLAHDTELDRTVAIKVPRSGVFDSEADAEWFHREARNTARLAHPGIVALHETGRTADGVLYLVTEYVEGRTLEQRNREVRMPAPEAAGLVAAIADALDHAHRHGVIHRDVKPSNVLIDAAGRPHVMDFGLSKREGGGTTATTEGAILGTPAYMSPEQARGESRAVDARTDVYSLGVVLYELLCGQRPFQGNHRMLLLQVLEDEPRPPRRLDPRAPADLETICLKAMAKEPAGRYAGAAELRDDLRRWLAGEPVRARPPTAAGRLLRWCRRNPVAAGLIPAIAAGAAVGLWRLSEVSDALLRESVFAGARMQAGILEEMNDFYSEIVFDLDPKHVEVTHLHAERPGSVPLPATFTIEAGRRISRSDSGMQVRLYSDHPFPWRKDGGPRDRFERRALDLLRSDPSTPVHEFADFEGSPVLRYAQARVMKASCLECHNHRPDSPKKDWKAGDVRGVLEIIRPLDREEARARAGRWQTILILVVSVALALGLGAFGLARHRRPSAAEPHPGVRSDKR